MSENTQDLNGKTQNDEDSVTCSVFGENFKLRCTKKDKQKLLKAVSLIEEKSLAMLKENPFLLPLQAAILVALNIESELLDYKESKKSLPNEATKIIDSIRASEISDITVVGKGYMTFDALDLMAENNIKLIAINPRGRLTYTLESPDWRNVKLKKEQYKLSENRLGLEISRELIMSKMKNQKATLTTLNKNKQLKRVYGNRQKIEEMITKLNHLSLTGDNGSIRMKIMGIEGKASNEYWKGVKHFVPNEINFESRTNKPTDILNSMLNYGYAILASEITKSILVNGLDPYCGLLHFDMDNRTSLTFDLIEPFRQQIVDKTVISLINRKQVTLDDMDKRNNTIKLKARKLIVEKILSKVYSTITYCDETVSYSDLIVRQSENLVNSLLHGEKFNGFYLRW